MVDPANEQTPIASDPRRPRWYARWWGIILVLFIVVFSVTTIVFLTGLVAFRNDDGDNPLRGFSTSDLTDSGLIAPENAGAADLATSDDPSVGSPDAPITIVAFEDFQCPFSERMFSVIREMTVKYPETIRLIYRDYPVVDAHPDSLNAAMAAECASVQGKFWAYHDRLFQNQDDLSLTALTLYARQSNLDVTAFESCLTSETYRDEVIEDLGAGYDAGVRGTPTLFFNGYKVEGAFPVDAFEQIIQRFAGSPGQ